MTSSIRPIFMPERARARRADWAPGPGVLVPLPIDVELEAVLYSSFFRACSQRTSSSTNLDVKGVNAQFLATNGNILSRQHSSVGRRFVTVSLDLHSTGDTADCFAATGITQNISQQLVFFLLFVLLLPTTSFFYSSCPAICVYGLSRGGVFIISRVDIVV